MSTKLAPLLVCAALAGCYGTVYTTPATSSTVPDLLAVGNGAAVIADYDLPIFYAAGFYWYNDQGAWYRSTNYTGGWQYTASPPYEIVSIASPNFYVHYRPFGYVPHIRPVPSYYVERPYHPNTYYY